MHRVRQAHSARPLFPYTLLMVGCLFVVSFVLAQSAYAAVFRDDATGGDCSLIGVWDGGTKTCALTRDINDSIRIEGDGITFDGKNHALAGNNRGFGVVIKFWENNTVRNLTVRGFEFGIYISHSQNNVITKNIITNNAQTGIVLSGSHGTMVTENEISNNATSGIEVLYIMLASENKVYRNNIINNGYQIFAMFDPDDFFSQPLPLGGNYWSDFDEPAEGCHDTNRDNICDSPRIFEYGEDAFPWTTPNGWLSAENRSPTLSFSEEPEFISDGIDPNKGTPATVRTFKVVYTDRDNNAPAFVKAVVSPQVGNIEYTMSVDTSVPEPLRDGNYTNGEQYTVSKVFPKGEYSYFFETRDANSSPIPLPATGALHFTTGYSNVAFLPGHQASRLYWTDPGCLFLNCENRLWEPNHNADVKKLYLNSEGISHMSDIYTRDVIDEAFGFNVYKTFIESMNEKLVNKGIIKEWRVLPYDWRYNQIDIVNGDILLEKGATYQMMEELEELAQTSGSGKVTLITHSNGGLLAKALVSRLRAHARAGIIDNVIMVAAPQVGTPEALMGLLHGGQSGFFEGWLPSHETMREMGEHMPSAYNLLPSRSYFNTVDTVAQPVIEFSPTSITAYLRGIYGDAITGFDNLNRFLTGEGGVRIEPAPKDVRDPNVLNAQLLDHAQADQAFFSNWELPPGINLIQIAGWGLDTLRGIRYEEKRKTLCNSDLTICTTEKFIDPQPLFTEDGDKTVVVPSAVAMDGKKFYVNLKDQNKELLLGRRRNRKHSDIFEVQGLQNLIKDIIEDNGIISSYNNISSIKPEPKEEDKKLRIRVHSPVSLDLYDGEGNHTGVIQNPDPNSDIRLFEEQISNSYYLEIGEGKYAGSDASIATTIVLKGQSLGTVTLEIDEISGAATIGTLRFSDIPVAQDSTMTMNIQSIANETSLNVDLNSDGIIDFTLSSSPSENSRVSLEMLAGIIQNMDINDNSKKKLIKDIEKIQKHLKKEAKHNNKEDKGDEDNDEKGEGNKEILKGFLRFEKDVREFVKKAILSWEDGEKLLQIIGTIRQGVVK